MDTLTAAIQRCQLSLKLDNETEGQGNCFPNSIVQQCRRPEVREWLKQNNPPALFNGQQWITETALLQLPLVGHDYLPVRKFDKTLSFEGALKDL